MCSISSPEAPLWEYTLELESLVFLLSKMLLLKKELLKILRMELVFLFLSFYDAYGTSRFSFIVPEKIYKGTVFLTGDPKA